MLIGGNSLLLAAKKMDKEFNTIFKGHILAAIHDKTNINHYGSFAIWLVADS